MFAPGYSTEEIKEIADALRKKAGLPDEPIGDVIAVPRPKNTRRAKGKAAAGAGRKRSTSTGASMPSEDGLRAPTAAQARSASKPAGKVSGKPVAARRPAPRGVVRVTKTTPR